MTAGAPHGVWALPAADRVAALQRHLADQRVTEIPALVAPRRAAVAAVLREGAAGPELLLMRRAERPGDRWSGQVSMPGGMAEAHDADSQATAVREAREEVGLDLTATAQRIGRLDDQIAIAKGRVLPMAITPWVFALPDGRDVAPLVLNHEAAEAFWLPLLPALRGEIADRWSIEIAGIRRDLPAWRWQQHVVWGLTHRMISGLLAAGVAAGRR